MKVYLANLKKEIVKEKYQVNIVASGNVQYLLHCYIKAYWYQTVPKKKERGHVRSPNVATQKENRDNEKINNK